MSIKNSIIKFGILFFFVLLFVACDNNPAEPTEEIYKPFEHIQLMGHGGECDLAPPNTLPAFEYAVTELGLHWIECDPILTKDGVFVLCHPTYFASVTGGKVADFTYEELLDYDFGRPEIYGEQFAGTKIATVREAISFAKEHNAILEFDFYHFETSYENINALWNLVIEGGYESGVIFEPNSQTNLTDILKISSDINVIYVGCKSPSEIPEILSDFSFAVVCIKYQYIETDSDFAEQIHNLGFKAASSCILPVPDNPIEKLNELISLGFDYIYTQRIPYSAILQE